VRYSPEGVPPPVFSVEEARGRDDVDLLKTLGHRLDLERRPGFVSEGTGEAERLKTFLIGSKIDFFPESLRFCELSCAMLVMVRDDAGCYKWIQCCANR
jgi:hypothetical protein